MTIARLFLLLSCMAAFGGCSMLRTGYGQLDSYAAWKADEYFDLDAHQKQEFHTRFARLHEWHRRHELPDYAAFLSDARGRLQKGIARDDVLWIYEGVKARYRSAVQRGADDAAALLLTVTPAQLEALRRRWDKDNLRFIREHRLNDSAEEQRYVAVRRITSRIRDWTDGLEIEQEERIMLLARELTPGQHLRHEDRLRRQREFLQLMAQRGEPKQFTARLRHWLLNWEEGRSPEYARQWAQHIQKQADFYAAVDKLLTPRQRAAVADRLRGYAKDFAELSKQPAAGR